MTDLTKWLPTIMLFVFGILFGIIGYLFQRSVIKFMDDLKSSLDSIVKKLDSFKEEVIKDYVRKSDCEKNESCHSEFRNEIKKISDNQIRLEERLNRESLP